MLTKLHRFLGRMKVRGPRDILLTGVLVFQLPLLHLCPLVWRDSFWLPLTVIIAFAGMFILDSYATLGVGLCATGMVAPVLIGSKLLGWGICVPCMVLGLACCVRGLVWRDRHKNHHYTTL